MGVVNSLVSTVFGGERNLIKETAEVFRENTEAASLREAGLRTAALEQFGQEFAIPAQGAFDRFIDGLNRIPRPLMAFGTIGLCVMAMVNPIWFAARMQGIALVPEPLWWLMGAIVSFYFGARYQVKGQEFQNSIARSLMLAPRVTANIRELMALKALEDGLKNKQAPEVAPAQGASVLGSADQNPALKAWRAAYDE
jgi:hypothetical protein